MKEVGQVVSFRQSLLPTVVCIGAAAGPMYLSAKQVIQADKACQGLKND